MEHIGDAESDILLQLFPFMILSLYLVGVLLIPAPLFVIICHHHKECLVGYTDLTLWEEKTVKFFVVTFRMMGV